MLKLPSLNRRDNRVTRTQLREAIERNYRTPFKDVLAELMQCRPTPQALLMFAVEHPDKWANAVATMARLSGYNEEIDVNLHTPDKLGDAQLLQRLSELRIELGFDKPTVPTQTLVTALEPVLIDQAPTPTIHGPLSRRKKGQKKGDQNGPP